MIEVEGPATIHNLNSGARAANEADSRQRRGPANQRRSLHPGGGQDPPAKKKREKIYLRKKFNKKLFFFAGHFFHNFSWRVGNTSGFGMQLCLCVWLDRY